MQTQLSAGLPGTYAPAVSLRPIFRPFPLVFPLVACPASHLGMLLGKIIVLLHHNPFR